MLRGALLSAIVLLAAAAPAGAALPRWHAYRSVPGAVDVAGPRADGGMVVAGYKGLWLMSRSGRMTPFARGPGGYVPAAGEPYIALSLDRRVAGAGCSFRRDDIYALQPADHTVVRVDRRGRVHPFAQTPAEVSAQGIAYDTVGSFGHRLLVAGVSGATMTLYAFDCRGRPRTIASGVPRIEGGMTVAPRSFGRYGGHMVGADELTGRVIAVSPGGRARVVAESGLPAGGDTGIEAAGFVPRSFRRALFGDPGGQPAPHAGSDSVLELSRRALVRAGARTGDLLVAAEGGGATIRVRCTRRCTVRQVAAGPAPTHAEGHIAFQ